jgi:SLT domain-containing protein
MAIAAVPSTWFGPLSTLIMRESGGKPRAINTWDINAKRGTPSMGLMQTIGPTFSAYRNPGLPNDPYDPIANIVAGINYIKARYGSVFNVQQAVGTTPKGYRGGGWLYPGQLAYNETDRPEAVLSGDQSAAFLRMAGDDTRRAGGDNHYHLTINTTSSDLDVATQFRRMEIMAGAR